MIPAATGGDPYVYPGTDVLRNRAGIQDRALLERFERRVTSIRMDQLAADRPRADFTVAHFMATHRQIFQDVYEWAGQFRTVNLARGETQFAPVRTPVHDLESWGQAILSGLKSERHLQGLDLDRFVGRLGHYTTEVNYWHPAREGNGRTTREFIGQLARNAGFDVDYTRVSPQEWNRAAAASDGDPRAFAGVFKAITTVPRAVAFDREPRELALRQYPELIGAYRTVAAVEAATARVRSDQERTEIRSKQRGEISKVLHEGRLIDPPRQRTQARQLAGRELSR